MRKVIAAINATLDGYCDHTAINPDDEIHQHYDDLLKSADDILYGRITYQLMEYWPTVVANPTGIKALDDFAVTIDDISKIVFSRTLKNVTWKNSRIAKESLQDEINVLKQSPGRDILIGSPGLIIQSLKQGLVDEFQLCIHPVIAGEGLMLFKDLDDRIDLKLLRTKTFRSGALIMFYRPS